jgi:glycosyltransferase 2 family protein
MTPRASRAARWTMTAAFFAAVIWLLGDELRELDTEEILAVVRGLSPSRIAAALVLTAASYSAVAGYDRLSARYAGVRLPPALGFSIPFVSYAFNFNVGAMVGAVGFRLRLYSRQGIDVKRIGAITVCSIVTNWCGCLTVLGAMLIADPSALHLGWGLSATTGRLLGLIAWAPVAAYLVVTALRKEPVRFRGTRHPVPRPGFALAQVVLGSGYWLLVPLVIYALRPPELEIRYSQLAVAYGVAALGGVIVRVPAGLGVLEAVFLEIFRGQVGAEPILGMLIAWRALFLLVPLGVATVVLTLLEYRAAEPRAEANR